MRRGAGLIVAALCGAAPVHAQEARDTGPRLAIEIRRDSAGILMPPVVRASSALQGGVFDAALRNGFPVQLHFRLELYRDTRLFDQLAQSVSWAAVVRRDPIDNHFDLVRTGGTVERFADADALGRALEVPFTVDLLPRTPPGRNRYYYAASLEIESLNLTELEEVEQWLRGDFEPAVRRGGDVGTALGRGARRVMIRLSGLPRRRTEARTPPFIP